MAESLIVGIVSGIISSTLCILFTRVIKPRLKVADVISLVKTDEDKYEYRIKFINKSKCRLIDLYYELNYCTAFNSGQLIDIERLNPQKQMIKSVAGFERKSESAKYAVRIGYIIDNKKCPLLEDGTKYLEFNITATHSLTGTKKTITKRYYKKDVKFGQFQTKESLDVLEY